MRSRCIITFFLGLIFFSVLTTGKVFGKSIEIKINENPKELVGKWIMDGDKETYIDLKLDGTAIEKSIGEPLKRYWFVKDNMLCLKATEIDEDSEKCLNYRLQDDELTLVTNKMMIHYNKSKIKNEE
ncbi:hypothetical protein [Aquimarina pacifica]|uniref:hypothetical protein n=1 Tax=Aquimarina pacifica TaxID=1296415 RepID=UPI001268C641|nr:hypothetical protein [Aquimarina pacifica]